MPPASSTNCTVPLARSRSTSATMTLAPSSANRSDVARPTPDPPPMTTIDFPSSCMVMLLLLWSIALRRPASGKGSASSRSLVLDELDRTGGARLPRIANRLDRISGGVDDHRLGLVVVRERARRVDDAHAAAHAELAVDDNRRCGRGLRHAR